MNAISHLEAGALAALKTSDPGQNLILVPLSRLVSRPSGRNTRKTAPRMPIPELAESIRRINLLQNLVVTEAGENYEVIAGSRRLAALKLLAKRRIISKDWEVPCLLVSNEAARTASLTENVQREAMHPADQFEAFAALVAEGRSIEDIAADFGVTPLVVQRRLKLANVSPRLLADYRAGAVALDQLMALAIVDDHAAQEAAFYDVPEHRRGPSALRERLTEREIDAGRNPLARFVGLQAYEIAGGGIRRDLFADGDTGVYLSDAALLQKLAQQKLDDLAVKVRAEGWSWVEVNPAMTWSDLHHFQRAPQERRAPTEREAARMDKLKTRMQELGQAVDAAIQERDQDRALALQQKGERLGEQLQELEDSLLDYSPTVKAAAGAIVTLDRDGEAAIHRGLLREAEAKALRMLDRARRGLGEETPPGAKGAKAERKSTGMSDRLAQRLSVHRTAALQIELARHPQAALAATVHGMVQAILQSNSHDQKLPLGLTLTVKKRLQDMAPDWPDSPAAVALRELQQVTGKTLPQESAELWAALLAKPQDDLVRLLAICIAATVDVVTPRAMTQQPGMELAQAVGLDMAAWWKPTAEGYFKHVSRNVILQAASEFAPQQVTRLAKLKKNDLAEEAEKLAQGTGWIPAVFRAEGAQDTEAQAPADTPETVENEERDEALAA